MSNAWLMIVGAALCTSSMAIMLAMVLALILGGREPARTQPPRAAARRPAGPARRRRRGGMRWRPVAETTFALMLLAGFCIALGVIVVQSHFPGGSATGSTLNLFASIGGALN